MKNSYVQMVVYDSMKEKALIQDIIRFPKDNLFIKNGHPSASGRFMFERMIEESEAGRRVVLETGIDDYLAGAVSSKTTDTLDRIKEIKAEIKNDMCLGA